MPDLYSRIAALSLIDVSRIAKFLSTGTLGALIDNGVLFVLVEFTAIVPVWGAVISKELAIIVMFLVNDSWTFPEFETDSFHRRLVKSNLVRLGGLAVGVGTLYVLHSWLHMWYIAANIIGIGAGFLVNYVAESTLTWRVHQ